MHYDTSVIIFPLVPFLSWYYSLTIQIGNSATPYQECWCCQTVFLSWRSSSWGREIFFPANPGSLACLGHLRDHACLVHPEDLEGRAGPVGREDLGKRSNRKSFMKRRQECCMRKVDEICLAKWNNRATQWNTMKIMEWEGKRRKGRDREAEIAEENEKGVGGSISLFVAYSLRKFGCEFKIAPVASDGKGIPSHPSYWGAVDGIEIDVGSEKSTTGKLCLESMRVGVSPAG